MAAKTRAKRFETEDRDGALVIRFTDPILEEDNRWVIEEQVFSVVEETGRKELLLDLSKVRFMSSSALGALLALQRKMQAVGGQISIINLNPETAEVLRATKLDKILDIRQE